MFWLLFVIASAIKCLLIPAYYSTDFEVHRNWLAITHSLPISKWYTDQKSQWTLDYPPFFAYFEYMLSYFAKYFDVKMLDVNNLNYESYETVLFQRLTVIFADINFAVGVLMCLNVLKLKGKFEFNIATILLLGNVGLIFVDHIHFQYNGFLLGFLLLSIGKLLQEKYLQAVFLFCTLLNLKHIFLYVAPVYFVYILKLYCIDSKNPLKNLIKVILVGITVFFASFGPFIHQLPQVFSRLFPFKRGLTHAYWAPNFWAVYNFVDKVVSLLLHKSTIKSNTSGIVKEFNHTVLPSINPMVTFLITGTFMLPCLIKLYIVLKNRANEKSLIRAIVICSCTSFIFGWHVHEKAILLILVPLSLLAVKENFEAKQTLFMSIVGYYSLFPLLFSPNLLIVKLSYYLFYIIFAYLRLIDIHRVINFKIYELIYISGFFILLLYTHLLHYLFRLNEKFEFLPLMLTSVYCSIGVIYFYITYYIEFLKSSKYDEVKKVKKKKRSNIKLE